jgi:hypothetical protein
MDEAKALSTIAKLKANMTEEARLVAELEDAIYLKSIFPSIAYPASKHTDTRWIGFGPSGFEAVTLCWFDDAEGVRYYLTLEQYNDIPNKRMRADKRSYPAQYNKRAKKEMLQ